MDFEISTPIGSISLRGNSRGAAYVAQDQDAFSAAVDRGNVYHLTAQATVVTQAGLSATTPALTIANRAGSGKVVRMWYSGCTTLVVNTAVAAIFAAFGRPHQTPVVETTAGVLINAKTGDAGPPPGVAGLIVSTLPAAPVAVGILGSGLTDAPADNQVMAVPWSRWWNGSLQIPERANFSIQTSTAMTLFCDYIFEVVDK